MEPDDIGDEILAGIRKAVAKNGADAVIEKGTFLVAEAFSTLSKRFMELEPFEHHHFRQSPQGPTGRARNVRGLPDRGPSRKERRGPARS